MKLIHFRMKVLSSYSTAPQFFFFEQNEEEGKKPTNKEDTMHSSMCNIGIYRWLIHWHCRARIQSMVNEWTETNNNVYFDGDGVRCAVRTENKQTVHKSKNLEIGFDKSENLLRGRVPYPPS